VECRKACGRLLLAGRSVDPEFSKVRSHRRISEPHGRQPRSVRHRQRDTVTRCRKIDALQQSN
jgi:hypothetical protein